MLVALLTAVARAMVTARLAFGRGIVEETQERTSWKTEKEPTAWRNMAWRTKYVSPDLRFCTGQWTYEVAGAGIMRGCRQHLADDGDAAARDDVEASLLRLAAVPRVGDGVDAGQEVGRGREKQGLDVAEAEGLDDRGEEVWRVSRQRTHSLRGSAARTGEAHAHDGAGLDQHEQPGLCVGDRLP